MRKCNNDYKIKDRIADNSRIYNQRKKSLLKEKPQTSPPSSAALISVSFFVL